MELMAVIVALEALKRPCNVKVYSDSKYIVDAINLGWVDKWKSLTGIEVQVESQR